MALTSLFPILSSHDLSRLVDFYVRAADADVSYQFPGPDGEPAYVALEVAGGHLGLGHDPAAAAPSDSQRAALWFYADDCDAACERFVSAGASLTQPPADMPWGERVADLVDPDGNRFHVGQRL